MQARRNRLIYGIAILGVIALGLLSRAAPIRAIFGTNPGDALWATMVFLALGWVFPRIPSKRLALASWLVAMGVELSQLAQTPWLVAIRQTTLGHLALGSTFYWPDLVAYTIGIALAFFLEIKVLRPALQTS